MNILQLCIRFPPGPGGAENHVFHISKELLKRGYDLKVFTSDLYTEVPFVRIDNHATSYKGVSVQRFRSYSLGGDMHYIFIPSMLRAILKEDTDIIHTHSYGYFQSTSGAFAKKLRGLPMVITPHFHPSWSMWGGKKRKQLRKVYDSLLGKPSLSSPDAIICHSENEKNLLAKFSVPHEKIRIIPAGVDFSRFESLPSPQLFRNHFRVNKRIILYAGRLASNKGLLHLMDAAPKVLSQFKDTIFVLVGEDEGERKRIEDRAAKLGIRDKVLFTGHIKDEKLFMSAYCACDVFVLPSEYEAFGLVLLEAMACEKPCVATRVGGVPEVIEEGKTGVLVEYGDSKELAGAINNLLADEKKRNEMGDMGRKRVKERFTWPIIVDKLERVYEDVLKDY
jgi:glycosyltransferase involved in cell wall biosynthesis